MIKKGFTLVELLSVIVIIGVISMIAVGSYSAYIHTAKSTAYEAGENSMEGAAESLLIDCMTNLTGSEACLKYSIPDIGKQTKILLTDLVTYQFMEPIQDPENESTTCDASRSYVLVTRNANASGSANYDIDYKGCLICSNYMSEGCTF